MLFLYGRWEDGWRLLVLDVGVILDTCASHSEILFFRRLLGPHPYLYPRIPTPVLQHLQQDALPSFSRTTCRLARQCVTRPQAVLQQGTMLPPCDKPYCLGAKRYVRACVSLHVCVCVCVCVCVQVRVLRQENQYGTTHRLAPQDNVLSCSQTAAPRFATRGCDCCSSLPSP